VATSSTPLHTVYASIRPAPSASESAAADTVILPTPVAVTIDVPSAQPFVELPRTTAYRRKRDLERGVERLNKRLKAFNSCSKCSEPLTAATGHSKYRSYGYCPSSGLTKEQWMAHIDAIHPKKK